MTEPAPTSQRLLLTIPEIVEATGRVRRQVQRWIAEEAPYEEERLVQTASGHRRWMKFVDTTDLPWEISPEFLAKRERARASEQQEDLASRIARAASLGEALDLVRGAPPGRSLRPLIKLVRRHFPNPTSGKAYSMGHLYRLLRKGKSAELAMSRADVGVPRIPQVAYELAVRAFVSNPSTTSVPMIHKTLLRAAPEAMTYMRGGRPQKVSVRSLYRIKEVLENNPRTRLLLSDADQRAEFLRVWSGAVVAEHANQLWQMDMTRCDVLVIDPAQGGKVYRPRVHVIIDVYSGVIVGIAFSESEDQAQTDLTLLRALLPKQGPFADRYPYWGIPERMYWDNGSTYKSAHARRVLASLGIEDVHSKPHVSHTRGAVERFFGTLHGLERSLPGYVGENASNRAAAEIKRLEKNARNWLKHGRDPGDGNRLLTITEYQNIVLSWLVVDYHATVVDGLSRHDHFVSTVPASSLVELDRRELFLLLAHRVERTVDAAGRIRLDNRYWTIPDGSLAPFQGSRVLVLTDQFAMEPERRLIVWPDHTGRLEVIGEAQPAPEVAASLEAQEHRRASRIALVEEARRQREMKRELTDPNVRVHTVLLKEFRAAGGEPLPPAARGQIAAVNPPTDVIEFAPDDPLGQALLKQRERLKDAPKDPIERARFIAQRQGKGMGDK